MKMRFKVDAVKAVKHMREVSRQAESLPEGDAQDTAIAMGLAHCLERYVVLESIPETPAA